jgi:PAS domain S-box
MTDEKLNELMTFNEARARLQDTQRELEDLRNVHSALVLRVQKIIANFPAGLLIVDKEDLKIVALNTLAETLFEYEKKQLVDQPITMLFPETTRLDTLAEPIAVTGRRMSGARFPAEILVNELNLKGQERLFINVSDTTERHKLEQLRKELVAMVSHDLRAPLSSIRLVLDMLTTGLFGEMTEPAKENIDTARSSTLYLDSLVRNLLDSELIDTGKLELAKSDTTIGAVIKKAIKTSSGTFANPTVKVETDCTNDAISVDEDRIVQVLINLMSNAAKFAPDNSTVLVQGQLEGLAAKFTVEDEGPGIPEDMQHLIFERFKQIEAHKSIRTEGFGLGLAICKFLVEKHGGKIWVENKPGRGSRFSFTISAI